MSLLFVVCVKISSTTFGFGIFILTLTRRFDSNSLHLAHVFPFSICRQQPHESQRFVLLLCRFIGFSLGSSSIGQTDFSHLRFSQLIKSYPTGRREQASLVPPVGVIKQTQCDWIRVQRVCYDKFCYLYPVDICYCKSQTKLQVVIFIEAVTIIVCVSDKFCYFIIS